VNSCYYVPPGSISYKRFIVRCLSAFTSYVGSVALLSLKSRLKSSMIFSDSVWESGT